MRKPFLILLGFTVTVGSLAAEDIQRRAAITRGGGPGRGDGCTVDVIVDGSAEVELRGDNAISGTSPEHNLNSGSSSAPVRSPRMRRGFRFNEADGRGRQELVRTPRDGGPVVVRIDDPQGGAGEYRFELSWGGDQGGYRPEQGDRGYDPNRDPDRDHAQYQEDRDRSSGARHGEETCSNGCARTSSICNGTTFPFTGDQSRLSTTIVELNELQGKWGQGRYDEHELGDVMDALSSVLRNNRLSQHDRDILTDDLSRMREFREHHDEWGRGFQRP